MDEFGASRAFAALSQPVRLAVFRLLVKIGSDGMRAGDIAQELSVRQNTMSTHLAVLSRAGLLTFRREGREIIYCADLEGMRALLAFLMEDCCGGRPELCRPLIEEIACEAGQTEGGGR